MSIKSLKKLSKPRFSLERFDEIRQELLGASDRSAAIVGGALVEDSIRIALGRRLRPLKAEQEGNLFENNGPLATFNSKIILAYAMGVFEDGTRRDLDLIRHIRNAFAHNIAEMSFGKTEVSDVCKMLKLSTELQKYEPKAVFIATCTGYFGIFGGHFKKIYIGKVCISDTLASGVAT